VDIPITKTVFGEEELRAVQMPLESGWVVQGPYVRNFEERFGAFVESPFSVATSNCTTALHLAVVTLGLQPGDEVIVPAFTWIATANVIEYAGARPVFCDIDLATFNIDVAQAAALVTSRTVGIMPVHLFGLCADMPAVMELAGRHGLWVIEDAACGLGARCERQHAGTFGDAGCFSFHPRKAITTGEGGMLITRSSEIDRLARSLRDHGADRSDLVRHENSLSFLLPTYNYLGYNYRMTDIQGALGCAQMDRLNWILSERRRLAARYDTLLADVPFLATPAVPDGYEHGYQSYVCLFRPEDPTLVKLDALRQCRDELMSRLEYEGIASRQGTHAPVTCGYYASKYELRHEAYVNAVVAENLTLTLPLYPQMTDEDQDRVVASITRAGVL